MGRSTEKYRASQKEKPPNLQRVLLDLSADIDWYISMRKLLESVGKIFLQSHKQYLLPPARM
jgi:hypothetical protein